MDKKIALILAEAQLCSDSGKGISELKKSKWDMMREDYYELGQLVGNTARIRALRGGYDRKDCLINDACGRIARNPNCGFHFWVKKDAKGVDVVYFQWKLEDGRHQASFHRPKGLPQWEKGSAGSTSYWDHSISRKELIRLLKSL